MHDSRRAFGRHSLRSYGVLSMGEVLWTSLWAAAASAFCAVVFNAGKYDILPGAIAGGIGWFIYRLMFQYLGFAEPAGYMCGAAALTLFSEIWAYFSKNPATVYLLPGLFPLVPGYGMFVAMHAAVTHNTELAGKAGYNAIIAAGSIALGMAVAASVARLCSMVKVRRHNKSKKSL